MKRREFIALVGGAAVGAPLAARAQHAAASAPDRRAYESPRWRSGSQASHRRVPEVDRVRLGWNDGKNIRVDYRYGVGPQIVE